MGGHYLFTDDEKEVFLEIEPKAEKFFRRWLGAEEFINGGSRWCLWLGDAKPHELRALPECMKRVEAVRTYRLASPSVPTQRLAERPTRFHVEFVPKGPYLLVPGVSSERRQFVPVGFASPDVFASNLVLTIPDATLYDFAVLNSTMHNAWMRAVCGRLESRYRYSASIVYNNFPWPKSDRLQRVALEATGQQILNARERFTGSTLADLYDPLTMPPELRRAHQANDRAVDATYGFKGDKSDAARVAFLFELYGKLTSLIQPEEPVKKRRPTAAP
ncbi:type IIL restriction-modification enzyme MmeI [Paraburkholderia tropica]|uniref:type IIL restriction-modification enzyme MmeI n=1 Tax=Paraburkholderia tropica TaxID=92647 RepID=UPI001ABC733B|nr:type IIL restriction-modification enzyme MmeI [Paraburkholderia tropica]